VGFVLSPFVVSRWGFQGGAIAFALSSAALMVLPYFAAPRSTPAPAAPDEHTPGFGAIAEAFRDRNFRAVVVLFAGAQMSFTVMTASAPYIAEKLLGGTLKDVALLLGPFLLAALPSFAFVPRLAARLGWEKFMLLATVTLGVVYSGAGLLGHGIIGSPMTTAMLVFASAGPAAAVILGLEGEAIIRSAAASRRGNTGIYFGTFNFVVQAMNGLAVYLMGLLAEQARESPAVVRLMPVLAGGLCLTGVALYWTMRRGSGAAAPHVA
jgi:Na+/melibiose symporter-like transporter